MRLGLYTQAITELTKILERNIRVCQQLLCATPHALDGNTTNAYTPHHFHASQQKFPFTAITTCIYVTRPSTTTTWNPTMVAANNPHCTCVCIHRPPTPCIHRITIVYPTTSPQAPAVATPEAVTPSTVGDTDRSAALQLENIRQSLIRQEDTIIFALIERAQFARNDAVYGPDDRIPVPAFGADGQRYSLLEYILREQEQLHGKVRRYTSPDEHAFFPEELPALVLPPMAYNEVCGCMWGVWGGVGGDRRVFVYGALFGVCMHVYSITPVTVNQCNCTTSNQYNITHPPPYTPRF